MGSQKSQTWLGVHGHDPNGLELQTWILPAYFIFLNLNFLILKIQIVTLTSQMKCIFFFWSQKVHYSKNYSAKYVTVQ